VPARPPGADEDAEIVLKFPQKYDYAIDKNAVTITTLSVDIGMNSPLCWVVSSQASNMDLLKHEQGHYDITALGAREFHDRLSGLVAKNETELNKKIKSIRDDVQARIDRANLNYDNQTNHSLNKQVQQTWEQKIDAAKKNPKGTVNDLP
jgi:predicted secreted Zn-dependent protease